MHQRIGVFAAWPYANGDLHLGHVAGVYLPADILARYHRLRGDQVLMVSGSDAHGTPITLQAEEQGVSPRDYFEQYHRRFLQNWQQLGISFNLFTHTDTAQHATVAQDVFRTLYDHGAITLGAMTQLYCEVDAQFLPDRYVEGVCPHCGNTQARGDQCDGCSRTLDAVELLAPRCRRCGSTPVTRGSEHFFLDLPAFADRLLEYIGRQRHWRPNVRNFARHYIQDGLRPRPVSRDMSWGIPLPVEGYEQKVMYVWFENIIGYLSASKAWAEQNGTPTAWEGWWRDPEARGFYFIGKDNIPFHALIWPAQLMGYDSGLLLPYDIPANEFLNLEGRKFSTSRGWAVWLPDYLSRYAPDPLRYYLTSIAPETSDSDFTWKGFVEHNNNEVLATWGNLVQRVLSFAFKHWEGHVPTPGVLQHADTALLESLTEGFSTVGQLYAGAHSKTALREVMTLARAVNKYLDDTAPWFQIKLNRQAAATTVYVALQAIDSLKLLFAPVLPFTSEQVHQFLGYQQPLFGELSIDHIAGESRDCDALVYHPLPEEGIIDRWQPSALEPGQKLRQPRPLFEKLDDEIIEQERQLLGSS